MLKLCCKLSFAKSYFWFDSICNTMPFGMLERFFELKDIKLGKLPGANYAHFHWPMSNELKDKPCEIHMQTRTLVNMSLTIHWNCGSFLMISNSENLFPETISSRFLKAIHPESIYNQQHNHQRYSDPVILPDILFSKDITFFLERSYFYHKWM